MVSINCLNMPLFVVFVILNWYHLKYFLCCESSPEISAVVEKIDYNLMIYTKTVIKGMVCLAIGCAAIP